MTIRLFNGRSRRWAVLAGLLVILAPLPQTADASSGTFWDDDGSTHEANIEAIAAAGITAGCGTDKFCPKDPVTREQMAAFLHRALKGSIKEGTPTQFRDTSSSIFAGSITWLSATGITAGCDTDKFCPKDPVTREQMATFLTRALGLDPIQPAPNLPDGVLIKPGANLQQMVDSHPSGTVFVLERGVHHVRNLRAKNRNSFVGAPGAILDGRNGSESAFWYGGNDVVIQGLIFENYNVPAQRGVIESNGNGWKILDNEIRNNGGGGIRLAGDNLRIQGNHIHHNDQIGIVIQRSTGGKVVDNVIAHNNHRDRYEYGWESGGTKFIATTNLYVAHNNVHNNHGPGLWADHSNYRTTYEKNTARDNYGPGIFHEISYDAVIRDNTVTGNSHRFYVGGILVASSANVEVYGNTLSGNDGGIVGIQDNRGSGNRGTFQTTGLNVHHNNVSWTTGFHGVQVNSGPDVTSSNSIRYDHNSYTTSVSRPFRWGPSSASLTWQEWRGQGHDPNGTLD